MSNNKVTITDTPGAKQYPIQSRSQPHPVLEAFHKLLGHALDAVSSHDTYTQDPNTSNDPTYHERAQKFINSSKEKGYGVSREGTEIIATPPKATYKIDAEDDAPNGTAKIERRNGQLYSSSKPKSQAQKNLDESYNKGLDKGQVGVGVGEPANLPKSKAFPAPAVLKVGRRIVK